MRRMSKFLYKQLYGDRLPDLESLRESEWDPQFEQLMRDLLVMGTFRYGFIADAKVYGYADSIRQRLDLFEATGNAIHLVDIANACMMLFYKKAHPKFNFKSIDDGTHFKEEE